jgi:hypothetical protein
MISIIVLFSEVGRCHNIEIKNQRNRFRFIFALCNETASQNKSNTASRQFSPSGSRNRHYVLRPFPPARALQCAPLAHNVQRFAVQHARKNSSAHHGAKAAKATQPRARKNETVLKKA